MSGLKRALPHMIVVVLGAWLMAAPAVLGHVGTTAGSSDRLVGPLIAAIAFVAASEITRPVRWANVVLALWLVAAPWVLGFPMSAAINDVIVGIAVGVLSPLGKADMQARFGGGWSALRHPKQLPDVRSD